MKLKKLAILSIISSLTIVSNQVHAQGNIDNLPDDPQQLKTWRCSNGKGAIAVEAKDVKIWQDTIETNGWQCQEELSVINADVPKFSCEPEETIGILTVFWLEGEGGKEQLEKWKNQLSNDNGLICTPENSNPMEN